MKFKVGDEVIAKKNTPYSTTTNGWRGIVTDIINDEYMLVRDFGARGPKYRAESKYFKRVLDDKKIVITNDGITTTAKLFEGKKLIKTAEAKCSPKDEFDFGIGSALALERLMGNPDATLPIKKLMFPATSSQFGEVGSKTALRDINGEVIFVGDVVEVFDKDMKSHGERFICHDDEDGDFVMGICHDSSSKRQGGCITNGWRIIKRKSYTELKVGDIVDDIKVVEE